jgi:hypothetical protein
MSKKPLLLCLSLVSAAVVSFQAPAQEGSNSTTESSTTANSNADHIRTRVPLGNAIGHTAANEAKNPQSQGLDNANEHQSENQARFIEKHIDGGRAAERVERVERVERADRPDRPERVERADVVRPDVGRGLGAAARPDRPGLGKGR